MNFVYQRGQFHFCKITKQLYQRLKSKGIMNNHYLLIYNYVNSDNNIHVEEYGYEPTIESNICGFLISDKDIKYKPEELDKIVNAEYTTPPETFNHNLINSTYLGNYFEKGDDIVIKLTTTYFTYPNFVKSYIKKYSYENFKYAIKDKHFVDKLFDKFKEINENSPKNFEELIEYIKYNNPYETYFIKEISEDSFNHEFNYLDVAIYYDIRHEDEVNIAHEIETQFLGKDSEKAILYIYNNVNDIVTKIENECKRLGITDYFIKYLEPKNNNNYQMKYIAISYANLQKCNIEYDALDYY